MDIETFEKYQDYYVVPEEIVTMCSEQMVALYGSDSENNFEETLKKGAFLKQAGRTPIYLCTKDMNTLYVTSVEKLQNKYH